MASGMKARRLPMTTATMSATEMTTNSTVLTSSNSEMA